MSCFRVAGRLSVARLTQSLRASKHDGGASLVQQAPFISALYVRIGPGLAALGKSLFSCGACAWLFFFALERISSGGHPSRVVDRCRSTRRAVSRL